MGNILQQAVQQNNQLLQRSEAPPPVQQETPAPPQGVPQPAQDPAPPQGGPMLNKGQPPQDEKATLDKFIGNAVRTIHTPKVTDNILNGIRQAEDKIAAVGDASASIVGRLTGSASESGKEITTNALSHGANVVVGEIANLVNTAGIDKMDEGKKYQAYSWAMSKLLEEAVNNGSLSQEQLVEAGKKAAQTPEGGMVAQQIASEQGGV